MRVWEVSKTGKTGVEVRQPQDNQCIVLAMDGANSMEVFYRKDVSLRYEDDSPPPEPLPVKALATANTANTGNPRYRCKACGRRRSHKAVTGLCRSCYYKQRKEAHKQQLEHDRWLVIAEVNAGLSYREIAKKHGMPLYRVQTVMRSPTPNQENEGREKMRRRLDAQTRSR